MKKAQNGIQAMAEFLARFKVGEPYARESYEA